MAIANYSDLKAAIVLWAKRTDLTDVIPNFITIAEARINRSFTPRAQEQEDELTTVAGTRYVTLPSGVINPIGLWLKAYLPRQKLTQCLPEELPVRTNVSGYPEYWAIDVGNIAFDKLALSAWTFDFRYLKTMTLSDAAPTNYVLTNDPDLYLWSSMVEASTYMRDDAAAAMYEQRFQEALLQAAANENDTRATAPLMTDIGAMGRQGRFNIIRGY
jgi:hypothetical protein